MQYSIVNYKKIKELETLRLDAEYFHPSYLRISEIIKQNKNQFASLKKLKIKCDASAFYPTLEPYYGQGEIPFIRVSDVDGGIDYDKVLTIPKEILDEYKTLNLGKRGDILLTKGGSIARAGLITKDSALSRDLIFFNTSKLNKNDYIFYYVYCLTNFYKKQLIRSSSMTAQPHLTITLVKNIPFYTPGNSFKKVIVNIFNRYSELLEESRNLYLQAEKILLTELGLLSWKPMHKLSFVKNYSDTQQANRFDAEYFQPKYDAIIEAIKQYQGGFTNIGRQFELNKSFIKRNNKQEYRYVEISGVRISDGTIKPDILKGSELPTNAKIKLYKNDVIISKVRTYRGAISIIPQDGLIGSSAFTVLKSKGIINEETLMVYLRLQPLLCYSLKFNTGTSYPTLTDEDILSIDIPIIEKELQLKIKNNINKIYKAKKNAKRLLEVAKQGVELAIGKSEEIAESWINKKLKEINIVL